MGVRILENIEQGKAVIYDSVTDVAFGPVFRDWEEEITTAGAGEVADAFLDWLGEDPRQMRPFVRFGPGLPDLMDEYGNFIAVIENDGWDAVVDSIQGEFTGYGEEVTT